LLLALAAGLPLAGCGDDETSGGASGGGGSSPCPDYATFDGTSPTVSFHADVLPIFRGSCSLADSCHHGESGSGDRPYLGTKSSDPPITPAQVDEIFAQNVGVESAFTTRLIVDPGHPELSFMMDKLDGFACSDVVCDQQAAGCGLLMPYGATEPMDASRRDTIRRWIAQGAKND
jgi:hypothetical protein